MKAASFDYHRARDVGEAVALLRQAGGTGKLIAGGQSLGPMLNLRLVRVGLLVDIRRVAGLRGARRDGDAVVYGAAVTHSEVEDGAVEDAGNGLLRHVGAGIAYRAVRNRGTLGGSLMHADPAADWLSAFVALDARLHLQGSGGRRTVALVDVVAGAFSLDLADDELLTGIEVRRLSPSARWGWCKLNRKAGEFAHAIGVVVVDAERGCARVVCGALDGPPRDLPAAADAVVHDGRDAGLARLDAALRQAQPGLDEIDHNLHLVALRRAIGQAFVQ